MRLTQIPNDIIDTLTNDVHFFILVEKYLHFLKILHIVSNRQYDNGSLDNKNQNLEGFCEVGLILRRQISPSYPEAVLIEDLQKYICRNCPEDISERQCQLISTICVRLLKLHKRLDETNYNLEQLKELNGVGFTIPIHIVKELRRIKKLISKELSTLQDYINKNERRFESFVKKYLI